LDEIEGVGVITRNKLLNHFGSVDHIKKASFEELSKLVGKKLAERILYELKK
jgi:excinuclease ABC subunit C